MWKTYSSLFVGLLDCVTCDVCVSAVFGCSPLQSNIEAPGIHNLYAGRRPRQLCKQPARIRNQVLYTLFVTVFGTVVCPLFAAISTFCSPTIWRVSEDLSSKSSTFTHISYTPESSLSEARMNRMLSLSVLRMFTLFVSRGWPFFVQVTTGLGLPWGKEQNQTFWGVA